MKVVVYRLAVLLGCALTIAYGNAATLITPSITVAALTHSFLHLGLSGPGTVISDSPATGQFTQSGFAATLTGSELVVSQFKAVPGQKFVVYAAPAGFGNTTLTVVGEWTAGSDFGRTPITNTATFENLVGPAPLLASTQNVIGAGGKWVRSYMVFTVTSRVEFTGVQISAQFASSIASPTNQVFTPKSVSFSASASASQTLGDASLMTLESFPRPTIKIKQSGAGFVISWPTNFNNWVMESATQINSSSWATVTNVWFTIGTNCTMTNVNLTPARNFRLRTP